MTLDPTLSRAQAPVLFRSATLSSRIVGDIRDALFAKQFRPGDFLGTEKDLAARFKVSRMVARDALRTLEAQGVVEIKVGSGGGARIAHGNPQLFAEALAVQLDLTGVSVREIMEAQRAIECLAAELAAVNATIDDHARLHRLIAQALREINDVGAFTRSGREFHLAVAEASHNRVLAVQLVSLQHVSWPAQNPTLTADVARHIVDVHERLAALIENRDADAARQLMDEHVRMIASRRGAEHHQHELAQQGCC
jgi:GntR family transcriptional repressor for pyruvate dehydrogenase complex